MSRAQMTRADAEQFVRECVEEDDGPESYAEATWRPRARPKVALHFIGGKRPGVGGSISMRGDIRWL